MSDFETITGATDLAAAADLLDPVATSAAASVGQPVDFAPFEPVGAAAPNAGDLATELHRLHDVPVELTVEIGRTRMTIGETLALGPGSIVSLERLAGEPVDLLVNGKRIAHGEVVVIDEEFGLRITDLVESHGRSSGPADGPGFTASV